jgi:hypothetical protein
VRATASKKHGSLEAEVQVDTSKTISEVWALVYPPSYVPPEPGEDLIQEDVPKVTLEDPDADGVFTASYSGFVEQGTYRVVIYATDDQGLSARPREAKAGDVWKVFLPVTVRW